MSYSLPSLRERFPAVYEAADLAEYPFKQRLAIRAAASAFYFLIRLTGLTLRVEVEGYEHRTATLEAGKAPIYALWHDRIFCGTFTMRGQGIVVLTSKSFDGEYIARFLTGFGFGTVRGSSSRGGVRGLVEMIRYMKAGLAMAFTVDGPRGPRYEAKSGPIMLAKKTGNPIIPLSVELRNRWRVKSWDRLQIPKPFTKAKLYLASPIYVDPSSDDDSIESKRLELQAALDELVRKGEKWREA